MRFFKEVESVFNRARPKRHLLGKHKKKQIFLRNAFLEKSKQKIIKQWIKEQIDKTRNDYYNLNKIRQKNKMPKNIFYRLSPKPNLFPSHVFTSSIHTTHSR